MTMTLNRAGAAVDGILNREQYLVGTLRRMPLGSDWAPQVARVAKAMPAPAERSGASSVRGLIPSASADRAESLFLATVAIGAVVGLGLGAMGAAGFSSSWTSFVQFVGSLIG